MVVNCRFLETNDDYLSYIIVCAISSSIFKGNGKVKAAMNITCKELYCSVVNSKMLEYPTCLKTRTPMLSIPEDDWSKIFNFTKKVSYTFFSFQLPTHFGAHGRMLLKMA